MAALSIVSAIFPKKLLEMSGTRKTVLAVRSLAGGQMRLYEQMRGGFLIHSLPLLVSDDVALCTKAVAGVDGWF